MTAQRLLLPSAAATAAGSTASCQNGQRRNSCGSRADGRSTAAAGICCYCGRQHCFLLGRAAAVAAGADAVALSIAAAARRSCALAGDAAAAAGDSGAAAVILC